tara:strand:+ start:963 stop:1088 length:126 start_codon:yes stop_codon:yes gene_type:complete
MNPEYCKCACYESVLEMKIIGQPAPSSRSAAIRDINMLQNA